MHNDTDGQMCLICDRVEDVPTPKEPSLVCGCDNCGAANWVAERSPAASPKVCIPCIDPAVFRQPGQQGSRRRRYFH